ncbi:MAG: transporter substrate-binding domain-containing protein [Ruminococcaceae bacterium]|nr:transporter substrate-binding domain-containing protein [Oscillospiraceae bacterium]
MDKIASTYKLADLIIKDGKAYDDAVVAGDLDYIKQKGELIIGITLFAPMNYNDENGKLIGFETEFATAVCEKLGVTPKFVEINWNSKEIELNSKNIDCIWNGMTITPERQENMSISVPYMQNKQVMVSK